MKQSTESVESGGIEWVELNWDIDSPAIKKLNRQMLREVGNKHSRSDILETELDAAAISKYNLKRHDTAPEVTFLGIRGEKGTLRGFVLLWLESPGTVDVGHLYIEPELRKDSRFFVALLKKLDDYCAKNSIKELYFEGDEENERVIKLYSSIAPIIKLSHLNTLVFKLDLSEDNKSPTPVQDAIRRFREKNNHD